MYKLGLNITGSATMSETYEAWSDENGITFATRENILAQTNEGLVSKDAEYLHTIEANSWEEAMTAHHIKMHWKPYQKID